MKIFLYILFCIALVSCNLKEEEVIVSSDNGTTIYESDIYEVINAFFEDEKETNILDGIDYEGELLSVSSNRNYIHHEDLGEFGIITKEDRDFILHQINSLDRYDLKQEYISKFKLVPIDTMNVFMDYVIRQEKRNWEEIFIKFQNQFKKDDFYTITIPLFSLDKKTAIINFGRGFGGGVSQVYIKENGKWIRINKGYRWI